MAESYIYNTVFYIYIYLVDRRRPTECCCRPADCWGTSPWLDILGLLVDCDISIYLERRGFVVCGMATQRRSVSVRVLSIYIYILISGNIFGFILITRFDDLTNDAEAERIVILWEWRATRCCTELQFIIKNYKMQSPKHDDTQINLFIFALCCCGCRACLTAEHLTASHMVGAATWLWQIYCYTEIPYR